MTPRLPLLLGMLLAVWLISACGGSGIGIPPTLAPTPRATTDAPAPVSTLPPLATLTPAPGGRGQTPPAARGTPSSTPVKSTSAPKSSSATTGAVGAYPGRIVFDTTDGQIWLINADGTGRTKVGPGRSPLFAPDGKHIAFLEPVSRSGSAAIRFTVSAVDLDGSNKQTYCPLDDADPVLVRWSPRNRYIVVNSTSSPPGALMLCALDARTLNEQQFRQGPLDLIWDWTPDGNDALWQARSAAGADVYFGDPTQNGAGAIAVTQGQNRVTGGSIAYYAAARLSPDGKSIAVAGSRVMISSRPGQTSAYAGKVLDGFRSPFRLAWSPDGRALLISERGARALSVVDLATGALTRLAADHAGGADWSRQ